MHEIYSYSVNLETPDWYSGYSHTPSSVFQAMVDPACIGTTYLNQQKNILHKEIKYIFSWGKKITPWRAPRRMCYTNPLSFSGWSPSGWVKLAHGTAHNLLLTGRMELGRKGGRVLYLFHGSREDLGKKLLQMVFEPLPLNAFSFSLLTSSSSPFCGKRPQQRTMLPPFSCTDHK